MNLEETHVRRRSSASERAKQMEEINGIITGRNVLITGGAAGLGQAFLQHFLKHGAKVRIYRLQECCFLNLFSIGIEFVFFRT